MSEGPIPFTVLLADEGLELPELVGGPGLGLLEVDDEVLVEVGDAPLDLNGVLVTEQRPKNRGPGEVAVCLAGQAVDGVMHGGAGQLRHVVRLPGMLECGGGWRGRQLRRLVEEGVAHLAVLGGLTPGQPPDTLVVPALQPGDHRHGQLGRLHVRVRVIGPRRFIGHAEASTPGGPSRICSILTTYPRRSLWRIRSRCGSAAARLARGATGASPWRSRDDFGRTGLPQRLLRGHLGIRRRDARAPPQPAPALDGALRDFVHHGGHAAWRPA